jgi:hypothetical protein
MRKAWKRLKQKWGITNDFQVIIILTVFALTGFSTLYVEEFIYSVLGIGEGMHLVVKILFFIFLILPIYTVLLYVWGILLGQRKFFTKFILFKLSLLSKPKKEKI